jgi:hypothetical protein
MIGMRNRVIDAREDFILGWFGEMFCGAKVVSCAVRECMERLDSFCIDQEQAADLYTHFIPKYSILRVRDVSEATCIRSAEVTKSVACKLRRGNWTRAFPDSSSDFAGPEA